MWFKQQKDLDVLLKPIEEVKPLVKMRYLKSKRAIDSTEYSMLHDRYILKLKQIGPNTKLPEEPTSMRVIELDKNGHIAIHDVSPDKKKPQLLMTSLSDAKILNFKNAIEKIKGEDKNESNGEIRVLSVPALNVEAVWLHYDDGKGDKFALTVEFNPKDKQLFTQNQFLILLNERKYKLGKVKGKMGA